MVQSSHGDPADRKADINEWLWNEVWTDDVPAAVAFYQTVGGYRLVEKTVGDTFYRYLERDGQPRVGLLDTPSPRIGNTWVAYIRVADVDAAVNKAKALGGYVLMAPTAAVRNGTVGCYRGSQRGRFCRAGVEQMKTNAINSRLSLNEIHKIAEKGAK